MSKTIEQLAEQLGQQLLTQKLTLATAESCTGGGIAQAITSVPGSSQWFDRAFVTYTNQAKQEMLGVSAETLEQFGAVSEETVITMAEGALRHSDADISIAVSGIAGPDGGSKEKPVGTVWLAWAYRDKPTRTALHQFSGDRADIRAQAVREGISFLSGTV